jgi:hypothetical protein
MGKMKIRYVAYIYTKFTCTEGKFTDRREAIEWVLDAWEHMSTIETIVHDEELHSVEYHQVRKQEVAK